MRAPERREQILDVTTTLVAKDGFRAVTLDAVAREAGITRTVIYRHFADLLALLDAVAEREMARALAQVSETALTDLTDGPPAELMIESLRAYLQAVQTHPSTWRLVLMPPEGAPEILGRRIADGRAAVLAQLTGAVAPALAGAEGTPDPELTARLLSAISDHYARLLLDEPTRFSPERLLAHARWVLEQAQVGTKSAEAEL